jgi:hypothetical protein
VGLGDNTFERVNRIPQLELLAERNTRGFVKESVLRIENNSRNHPFQANFETLNMQSGLDSQVLLYKTCGSRVAVFDG